MRARDRFVRRRALLRRVECHLFLVPLDDQRAWFRYHHLFGQLLWRELRLTRPDMERLGHEQAAAWFRDPVSPASPSTTCWRPATTTRRSTC